nr:immunoglobulin [Oscillibacter ruminantium]
MICYNEEEATVYTYNKKLIQKLRRLSEKYPDKVKSERPEHRGAVSYLIPKRCVSVREPYSDRRREADSLRAKTTKIRPPDRSIRSKK